MGQPLGIIFALCGLIVIVRDSRGWLRAVRRTDVLTGAVIEDGSIRSRLDRPFIVRAVRIFLLHPGMIAFGAWAIHHGGTA